MLQASRQRIFAIAARPAIAHTFSSSSTSHVPRPNAPLELDSSMQALLQDVDISLLNYKTRLPQKRELEVLPMDRDAITDLVSADDEVEFEDLSKKSPAALFGSQDFRSVTLPTQLQSSINVLIAEADRPQLHADAKRLFANDSEKNKDGTWDTQYSARYRSREQAGRHSERDGTAFATIALPAHYSAIYSVFSHLKKRMGPNFEIEHVIDWGAGTGSGFWASGYSFQKVNPDDACENEYLELANSTVKSYMAIERRLGLVSIGKRLMKHVEINPINFAWKKSLPEAHANAVLDDKKTLAMSAFMLASLPTPLDRKKMVNEMWESGAHTLVIIDHNTKAGFEAVAEAREYLLKMGRKELEVTEESTDLESPEPKDQAAELKARSTRGSHVVAPCPHDRACPLYVPGAIRLVCGFSQRLQRPPFVRKTKHSGLGHEDIEYSYVVIRRGTRPTRTDSKVGRVGLVGETEKARENERQHPRELVWHDEHEALSPQAGGIADSASVTYKRPQTDEDLEIALRQEAYYWPRLVFAPLKKSGHIILDSCTAEGKIMRMTIPKSQGKQPFYDARKSSWGDLFPHESKNRPQERCDTVAYGSGKGYDIGKRKSTRKPKQRAAYDDIAADIKEKRKDKRKQSKMT